MALRIFFTTIIGLIIVLTQAFASDHFEDGLHFVTLSKPVVTADPNKIEVMELFWYGCSHCDDLEPGLKAWVKQLPSDVSFVRMPVVFGRSWEMHARMFWVAKNLKLLDSIHEPLFDALHRHNKKLQNESQVVEFFAQFGADPLQVRKELKSFATESALRLADARTRSYGIRGVPAVVVNGKYVTGVAQAGGEKHLFKLLDYLIKQSRH